MQLVNHYVTILFAQLYLKAEKIVRIWLARIASRPHRADSIELVFISIFIVTPWFLPPCSIVHEGGVGFTINNRKFIFIDSTEKEKVALFQHNLTKA